MNVFINQKRVFVTNGIIFILLISSCTKFVQVDPPITQITNATVYNNNTSAAAVMTSVYSNMMSGANLLSSGSNSISYLEGLTADELDNYSTDPLLSQFYENAVSSLNVGYWYELYNEIHVVNAAIEGLAGSTGVSGPIRQQITGEAKFMRAFLHFYATNLYGDIPLVTTTDYTTNNTLHRSSSEIVYNQIIQDLKDAQNELSDDFVDASGQPTTERVRPNKAAATALLARVYLYTEKWDSAEAQATALINNTAKYELLNDLSTVFLANSKESIWQLRPVNPGFNTFDAYFFVLTSPPGSYPFNVAISNRLVNAFETGDSRKADWVGTYTSDSVNYYSFPYKYKMGDYNSDPSMVVSEYTTVLRLAEQYLIRSEARARQNNIDGSQKDLNIIRLRAGLTNTTAGDMQSLLSAILQERRVELFTEWGHRWFDLKRTQSVDSVMSVVTPLKGGNWSPNWQLLPIPLSELKVNSNLTQNAGYN